MFPTNFPPRTAFADGKFTAALIGAVRNNPQIQNLLNTMRHDPSLQPERLENRIAPAGLVTVSYNSATGALLLNGDALDNSVDVFQTGADTYRVEGLSGTLLTGSGVPVAVLDIGKLSSLTIKGNDGADDFGLTDLTKLKSLKFEGGAGLDFLLSKNLAVKGDVSLDLGAGSGLAAFAGTATEITGDFKAVYGDGGGSVDFFATTTSIKGSVKLIGGSGLDTASFGGVVNLEKGIEISDAGLGMGVAFQNATAVIGKGRGGDSIEFNGGSGADSLQFVGGNITVKGDVKFAGGGGKDVADLSAATLKIEGKVVLDGGADADVLKIAGAQVMLGRGVSLLGGGGADELTLSGDHLTVRGDVKLSGGDGDDTLNVLAKTLDLSDSLTVLGGGGANVGSIFGDGRIRDDVFISMGGANGGGDQTFLMGGASGAVGALKIGGDLTVTSDATDPAHAGFSDFLWITDTTVSDDVRITMGSVDSSVLMDNAFIHGRLNINTGAGNDLVEIEQTALTGPSIIDRLATIQLGEGNDVIRIGKSSAAGSNDYVIFNGGLHVDGGPGNDLSNDFLSDSVNVFNPPSRGHDHDDDQDDDDDARFDGGHARFVKERLNFEGFLV